jgi:predicted nucleic acid-binding Zn ribbon protein
MNAPTLPRCAWCGKTIQPGRFGTRRHCNEACKQAAYRKRKAEKAVTPPIKP